MELEKEDKLEADISKILDYQKEGYLFHGSTVNNIELLEPRPASDSDLTSTFNNDTAVFATSNPQTCIFALISTEKVPKEILKGDIWITGNQSSLEVKIPAKWKRYMEDNVGTLYVVPPEKFIKYNDESWQSKSKEAVIPKDKITVRFEHFFRLGGKLVWTEE
ncbi:MAG: hypothetical protein ACOX0X_01020 [Candidatus Dojkabacteria bacterium]